jgi:hypothetical protein
MGDEPKRAERIVPLPEERQRLLEVLTAGPDPLYAVLDAARDLRALNWLKESGTEYASLYDGKSAVDLEMFAPYLARLEKDANVLRKLLAEAWGQSWGIYLTSPVSLAELRKHFRHFLMVEMEGQSGKTFYFRFYDPRVLRTYLPTCTSQEARIFFGPIGSYLLEDEDPSSLCQYRVGARGVERETTRLEKGDVPHP